MRRLPKVLLLLALAALPAQAAQRVFVASYGSDTNTAASCGFTNPCRSFTSALSVVDPGGEVVALDAAGYGVVTIAKSVTITSNPGFYAGISASAGNAVTIATAAVKVVLRGLSINGVGAANGIVMSNGMKLSIENCVISNFTTAGVNLSGDVRVRIVDSLIRDNNNGVQVTGATVDIATTKLTGNNFGGIYAQSNSAGMVSRISVADSVVADNNFGILSESTDALGIARVSVIRSSVNNNSNWGLTAQSTAGGTAVLTASYNLLSTNGFGLFQSGAGAVLESHGNNSVRQNGADSGGTITPVSSL
ncbi:MAG: right-handed parallel beta-helix repeat-containing protein [Usitatibacter sp.]